MGYAFGDIELDTERYELRRGGRPVPIQRKVFDFVRYLIERRGRVVLKAELLDHVWQGDAVSDSALTWCVSQARRALGQRSGVKHPIETVHGRGYRFAADVERRGEHAVASAAPGPLDEPPRAAGAGTAESPAIVSAKSAPAPFVGRAEVVERLASVLDAAQHARGRAALLVGESGIGKTRCLAELASRARSRGMRVLATRCFAGGGAPAFWPIGELAREVARVLPSLTAEAEAVLALIDPDQTGEAGDQSEPGGRFFARIERATRLLLHAAATAPLLISVDDVQWSDEATLRALWFLSREIEEAPLALCVALRAPAALSPGQQRSLEGFARQAERCELSGLSAEAVMEYVTCTLPGAGAEEAREIAAALCARTAGNPLLLQESVRALARRDGGRALHALDWKELGAETPARDLLGARLRDLDDGALIAVQAASVLGTRFEPELLAALVERSPEDLLEQLEGAEAAHVVEPAGAGAYRFAHDLLRELIYAELSGARRARLHKRAAELLEERGQSRVGHGELARHYREALALGTHAKVVAHARAAARAATVVGAHGDAVELLAWAVDAHERDPRAEPVLHAELLLALGTAQRSAGRRRDSRATLARTIELASQARLPHVLSRAALWLRPAASIATLEDPLAYGALQSARALIGQADAALQAEVLSQLACIPPNSLDMAESKRLSEQAVSLARSAGHPKALVTALRARLYALSGPDDVSALLTTADELSSIDQGKPRVVDVEARAAQWSALLLAGDARGERRAFEALLQAGARLPVPEVQWQCDRIRAMRALHRGEYDIAERAFAALHERAERVGLRYGRLFYVPQRLFLLRERGQLSHLPPLPPDGRSGAVISEAARGAALLDGERARAHYEELAQGAFGGVTRNVAYLWELVELARVAVRLSDLPRAEQLAALLAPYPEHNAISHASFSHGAVARFSGMLAATLGRRALAVELLERAIAADERSEQWPRAAESRYALARVLLAETAATARSRARAELAAAERAARELGMAPLLARCEKLARSP